MLRITSIGEILFDIYEDKTTLGGAPFNFIFHITALTGKGSFVSRIGNDEFANEIKDFLKAKNISADYLQTDERHPTGTARTNLDPDTKLPEWEISEDSSFDYIELNPSVEKLINTDTDCMYFGTLAQRSEQSGKTIQSLLNRNIKYFCDVNLRQNFYSKEIIEKSLSAADVVKMNIEELKILNDLFLNDSFDLKTSSEKLKQIYNIDLLSVTMGEDGSVLFQKNKMYSYMNRSSGEALDTVGAGDAYAAVLCLGYLLNREPERIIKTAGDFAGEIVKIHGALPENNIVYRRFENEIL